MPPKTKEGVIFVINVGKSSNDAEDGKPTFLQRAKNVVKKLIEKKIFICPNDEVGIICFGTRQVPALHEDMQLADWEMVKHVLDLKSSTYESSWPEGLNVAYENLIDLENRFTRKKIYLFNNFKESDEMIDPFEIDALETTFRAFENTELLVIGVKPCTNMEMPDSNASEKLIIELCKRIDREYVTLDDIEKEVEFFDAADKTTMGMKVGMEFMDVHLPIAVFKMLQESSDEPSYLTEMKRGSNYVSNNLDAVNEQESVTAYEFGGRLCIVNDDDENAMRYDIESKCMMISGFIRKTEVSLNMLTSEVARLVLPAEDSSEPEKMQFYSFAYAMARTNTAAIVRYVARERDAPKMGFLFPRLESEPQGLTFVEIAFKEQIYALPVSFKVETKDEKVSELETLIDDMIDATMLTGDEDHEEPLALDNLFDPGTQHMWNCISHRILHEEGTLPIEEFSNLAKVLDMPDYIKERSQSCIQKLVVSVKEEPETMEVGNSGNDIELENTSLPVEYPAIEKPKNEKLKEEQDEDIDDFFEDF